MAKKHCECCGAPLVEYKHALSKGLVRGLYILERSGGGPINLKDTKLNFNQRTNFYKLRYWGLVVKCQVGGEWIITQLGRDFLRGKIPTTKYAISYRGDALRGDGPSVHIQDVTDGWWYREDYAEHSEPYKEY